MDFESYSGDQLRAKPTKVTGNYLTTSLTVCFFSMWWLTFLSRKLKSCRTGFKMVHFREIMLPVVVLVANFLLVADHRKAPCCSKLK